MNVIDQIIANAKAKRDAAYFSTLHPVGIDIPSSNISDYNGQLSIKETLTPSSNNLSTQSIPSTQNNNIMPTDATVPQTVGQTVSQGLIGAAIVFAIGFFVANMSDKKRKKAR